MTLVIILSVLVMLIRVGLVMGETWDLQLTPRQFLFYTHMAHIWVGTVFGCWRMAAAADRVDERDLCRNLFWALCTVEVTCAVLTHPELVAALGCWCQRTFAALGF